MDNMGNYNGTRNVTAGKYGLVLAIGWIAAVISLFLYPFIFGLVGVVMGILATKGGSRAGLTLIVASIILMGIGMIYSSVILNYTRHILGI